MLLSRVAWQLYWSGRFLQRAQATARGMYAALLVASHSGPARSTALLPQFIAALEGKQRRKSSALDLQESIRFLVAGRDFSGSLAASSDAVRSNLRALRGLVSDEAWRYASALADMTASLQRGSARTQQAHAADFIRACLALAGVFHSSMHRDRAYNFWQLGRQLEAADMTSRLVVASLRCASAQRTASAFDNQLWVQVLKSLGMLESYRNWTHMPIHPLSAASYIISEPHAPGSTVSCISRTRAAAETLPSNRLVLRYCQQAKRTVHAASQGIVSQRLTGLDRMQNSLARATKAIGAAYFHTL